MKSFNELSLPPPKPRDMTLKHVRSEYYSDLNKWRRESLSSGFVTDQLVTMEMLVSNSKLSYIYRTAEQCIKNGWITQQEFRDSYERIAKFVVTK